MKLQNMLIPTKKIFTRFCKFAKVKGKYCKITFRFIVALVILILIFSIFKGFNLAGNFSGDQSSKSESKQIVKKELIVLRTVFVPTDSIKDITPSEFNVEVGKSYILEVDSKENGTGNMKMIMIQGLFETPLFLKKGMIQKLPFEVEKPGTYNITSAIGRVRGHIIAN